MGNYKSYVSQSDNCYFDPFSFHCGLEASLSSHDPSSDGCSTPVRIIATVYINTPTHPFSNGKVAWHGMMAF